MKTYEPSLTSLDSFLQLALASVGEARRIGWLPLYWRCPWGTLKSLQNAFEQSGRSFASEDTETCSLAGLPVYAGFSELVLVCCDSGHEEVLPIIPPQGPDFFFCIVP